MNYYLHNLNTKNLGEGTYKKVYNIQLNNSNKPILKSNIINLLNIKQDKFEKNINNYLYIEFKNNEFFFDELKNQKFFYDKGIAMNVYFDDSFDFIIMEKCNTDFNFINNNDIDIFIKKFDKILDIFIKNKYIFLDIKFDNICFNKKNFDKNSKLYFLDFDTKFCYPYNILHGDIYGNKNKFYKLLMILIFTTITNNNVLNDNLNIKLRNYLLDNIIDYISTLKYKYNLDDLLTDIYNIDFLEKNDKFSPKQILNFYLLNTTNIKNKDKFIYDMNIYIDVAHSIDSIPIDLSGQIITKPSLSSYIGKSYKSRITKDEYVNSVILSKIKSQKSNKKSKRKIP